MLLLSVSPFLVVFFNSFDSVLISILVVLFPLSFFCNFFRAWNLFFAPSVSINLIQIYSENF